MKDGVSGSNPDIGSVIILKHKNMGGMEGGGLPPQSELLVKLYERYEQTENSPMTERISLQLQIVDAQITEGGWSEEVIIETLADLRESACRESLTGLVARIDAVGVEHGYLKKE